MPLASVNASKKLARQVLLIVLIATASRGSNSELVRLIATGNLSDLSHSDFSNYRIQLSNFYQLSNFSLVWSDNGLPTNPARAVIEILRSAQSKGLEPEDYDGSRWEARLSRFRQPGFDGVDLARFDLAVTVSAIRYISDLAFGRVNPRAVGCLIDVDTKRCDLPDLMREIASGGNTRAILSSVEPPFEGYQRTLKALEVYRRLAQQGNSGKLPTLTRTVEPGGSYSGVSQLAHLLQRLGDLSADFTLPLDSQVYEGDLVDAVRHFQIRHGLDADGCIGKSTLQQLNTPISHRVRQLELTLERWRWVPHQFSRPPIVVNIPEFRLRAFDESYRTELEMKVVVGKAYRHRTPVFAADLKYVIFHPYWNVPRAIQRAELVPHLERDLSYLTKHGYEVVKREGQIAPSQSVSDDLLAKIRSGDLTLRQLPGAQNALGRVKFMLPNENNVYLHDTPAHELFSRSRRDFSHGCIRLEHADELAIWVLRDDPDWPPGRITAAMNRNRTIQVNLNHPIPVLIIYGTAVVLDKGDVRFFDDIYRYDALLDVQLAKRRR